MEENDMAEWLSDHPEYTLEEICERCAVSAEKVILFVEHGITEPVGDSVLEWRFTAAGLMRLRKALRIQRDLDVNLPGLALVFQLMDEMDHLSRRLDYLEGLNLDMEKPG